MSEQTNPAAGLSDAECGKVRSDLWHALIVERGMGNIDSRILECPGDWERALIQAGAAAYAAASGPPREPTQELLVKGIAAWFENDDPDTQDVSSGEFLRRMTAAYHAMYYAAPPAASAAPKADERDRDWILAMAASLGMDSGFRVPIVPEKQAFDELFAAVRAAPKAEPYMNPEGNYCTHHPDDPAHGRHCGEPPTPDDGRSDAPAETDAELIAQLRAAGANKNMSSQGRLRERSAADRIGQLLAYDHAAKQDIARLMLSLSAESNARIDAESRLAQADRVIVKAKTMRLSISATIPGTRFECTDFDAILAVYERAPAKTGGGNDGL